MLFKDEIATNGVKINYIRSAENTADILTKPLSRKLFRKCWELLGMKEFGSENVIVLMKEGVLGFHLDNYKLMECDSIIGRRGNGESRNCNCTD